ncbi:MAG: hypothetical protein JSC189_000828 [Candidatus Tokpelaia sp. JSC189]|nr:MAG: hypothetical protein JSC189_000828 [Candidatus Tokpelaia sp. JSC189]
MFYRKENDGITLFIYLIPKAAMDAINGVKQLADGKTYLAVRVRALAEDGKANKALIKFLAREMKIPSSAFSLINGAKARFKQLHTTGNSITLIKLFYKKLEFLSD